MCGWKTQTKLGLGTSLTSPVKVNAPVTRLNLRGEGEAKGEG